MCSRDDRHGDTRRSGDADDPHHAARTIRGDGRRRARRRHAIGPGATPPPLVKVLALEPGRRLHREQIIDRLWPEDTIDAAAPEAAQGRAFARRALAVPNSVVLRGESVVLAPDAEMVVDALQFEELAQMARSPTPMLRLRARRSRCTEASCSRRIDTRSGPKSGTRATAAAPVGAAEARRALGDRGRARSERRAAHLALMRRYAAHGDRHAALRQFERMDRTLRRELGVAPGSEAVGRSAIACSPRTNKPRVVTTR